MKKLLFILIISFSSTFAQEHTGEYKKKLTFSDTFFGNEETYQVCYPKEHRTFFYGIVFASATAITLFIVILYIKSKHNKRFTGERPKPYNEKINSKSSNWT